MWRQTNWRHSIPRRTTYGCWKVSMKGNVSVKNTVKGNCPSWGKANRSKTCLVWSSTYSYRLYSEALVATAGGTAIPMDRRIREKFGGLVDCMLGIVDKKRRHTIDTCRDFYSAVAEKWGRTAERNTVDYLLCTSDSFCYRLQIINSSVKAELLGENRASRWMSSMRRANEETICTLWAMRPCCFALCWLHDLRNCSSDWEGLFCGSRQGRTVPTKCAPSLCTVSQ